MANDIPPTAVAVVTHTYQFNDGDGESVAECRLIRRPSGTCWITSLWVHPDYRRKGYGARLFDQVITERGDVPLYLVVNPFTDQPLNRAQLHAWYARWGVDCTDVPDVLKREENE
jgi:GNAT superfamily N-acetyltransferase